MARPSMPNSTRMSSAIRMIACPCCRSRRAGLVRIFSTVNRICSDDDVVANDLLDDWSDRLERVPERDLDGLVSCRGRHVVAAGAKLGRRLGTPAAPWAVWRAVSCGGCAG